MSDSETIASQTGLPQSQVVAALKLLDAGNTVPFVARYRKEATGGLDEIQLRAIEDAHDRVRALAARKRTVLQSLEQQSVLSDELRRQVDACQDLASLEAIYAPWKPRRQTRGAKARERGLQPLAEWLQAQRPTRESKQQILQAYVDPDRDVPDTATALQGALDILAEWWAADPDDRAWLLEKVRKFGRVVASVKRGKRKLPEAADWNHYFDHREPVSRIAGHRLLAIQRGVAAGILRVEIELEGDRERSKLKYRWAHERDFPFRLELLDCADDAYDRILFPAVQSVVLSELRERAEAEAIDVFGKNIRQVLMAAPAGPEPTIGVDPGFRTGCKIAVVDASGKYLAHDVIYPTPPRSDTDTAASRLSDWVRQYGVKRIAIGNGTASRETDAFVRKWIKDQKLDVTSVVVSESGASIYSASELAAEEFPDLDLTVRGAISIARRLQDPLAELIKTDPKSIGVGQYQHDVNQSQLRKCLDRVVESCVNRVGVDLNMASAPLLSHVAGIGPALASNIVDYRDQHGLFDRREQLQQVPKLGPRAFEQAAGFLRIRGGSQPLDNSAVHPESYPVVQRIAKALDMPVDALVGNESAAGRIDPERFVDERFGLPTIRDIVEELAKPGRDPRSDFRTARFDDRVQRMEDLQSGMVLEGVVTNVTHFGAFVDLGVHQDALVHISQLADQYVSDPAEVIAVGDVVKVKILEVDVERKRISATRKF